MKDKVEPVKDITAEAMINSKGIYNKWLLELTKDERCLLIEMLEEYHQLKSKEQGNDAIALPHLEVGDKIKLYGKKTTIEGFKVLWNDGLMPPKYEIILLTSGRGDPFERSLEHIEILEPRTL